MAEKTTTEKIREAARDEGLLDEKSVKLPLSRWPQWAKIRYAGTSDLLGPEKVADPLSVDDVS